MQLTNHQTSFQPQCEDDTFLLHYISLFSHGNTPQKSNQDWKLITETLTGMRPKGIISSKNGKHVDLCFIPQPASFFPLFLAVSCYC